MLRLSTLFAFLLCLPGFVTAKTAALVIGNNDYQALPPLAVAVADAKSHCRHLTEVRQFESVNCLYDATKSQMDAAVFEFLRTL
ncbi:MAG: caspase family protein, partial [Pseudomonadota bacterium]